MEEQSRSGLVSPSASLQTLILCDCTPWTSSGARIHIHYFASAQDVGRARTHTHVPARRARSYRGGRRGAERGFFLKLSQGLQTDRRATDGQTDTHTEAVCTILLGTLFTVCYIVSRSQVRNLKCTYWCIISVFTSKKVRVAWCHNFKPK